MSTPMGEGRKLGEERPQRMLHVLENIARGFEGIAGEMKQSSSAMTSIAGGSYAAIQRDHRHGKNLGVSDGGRNIGTTLTVYLQEDR
jgi:hypothetical protein